MPRVLFVPTSLEVGGAEKQMVLLIKGLLARGWQCEVFALELTGPLRDKLRQLGVVMHDGGYRRASGPVPGFFMLCRAQLRLLLLALRRRPQVVHAYLPLANLLGALAGRLSARGAVVISYRALGTHRARHPGWEYLERLCNRLSHGITVNSQAVAQDTLAFDGRAKAKLTLIYNGLELPPLPGNASQRVEVRKVLSIAQDETALIAVGNLIAYKGHQDLIRALPRLLAGRPNLKLFLVGEDRGIGQELAETARRLGVARQLVFLGYRDDVPWLLQGMDLFVLPSHEEGFNNALLEAMAAGLPVVATEVGGNREALESGRWGILVPPHAPERIALAVETLLDGRGKDQAQGREASASVRSRFGVGKMVSSYIQLYEKLLARTR